jgi:hypothetical protein
MTITSREKEPSNGDCGDEAKLENLAKRLLSMPPEPRKPQSEGKTKRQRKKKPGK